MSETVPEGTRLLDFGLTHCPEFTLGPELVRHVKTGSIEFDYRIPKSQLDFYASYPHTEMHIKADAPVSDAVDAVQEAYFRGRLQMGQALWSDLTEGIDLSAYEN